MTGDFNWSELGFDFSPEDCAAVAKKIREDRGLSIGQFAGILGVSTRYIEQCEKPTTKSFAYLYKILAKYSNLEAKIHLRNHG